MRGRLVALGLVGLLLPGCGGASHHRAPHPSASPGTPLTRTEAERKFARAAAGYIGRVSYVRCRNAPGRWRCVARHGSPQGSYLSVMGQVGERGGVRFDD